MQEPNLTNAIAVAAADYVQDAMSSLSDADLDQLALSGPANGFAEGWANRPTYERFARVLTHDNAVRSLLKPSGRDAPSLYSFFVGTTLWARQVPAAVLASALFDHMMLGTPRTAESVARAVIENVGRLRRIAIGAPVDCRWIAGLTEVELPTGSRLETALGILRPIEPPWNRLPAWEQSPANVLVSGDVRMQIKVVQPEDQGKVAGDLEAHERAVEKVRLVRLALVLAQSGEDQGRPRMTVLSAGAPHLGWMADLTESYRAVWQDASVRHFSGLECAEVIRWCNAFAEHYTESVAVAVERILSAATERRQPADILIDSVTAWENIVGTEAETSFRVTAALACLLENVSEKRHRLLRDLQSTYRVRSKVVHGESADYAEVAKHARLALATAKRAIARLFMDQNWLLSLPSSRARADAILLGDPRLNAIQ